MVSCDDGHELIVDLRGRQIETLNDFWDAASEPCAAGVVRPDWTMGAGGLALLASPLPVFAFRSHVGEGVGDRLPVAVAEPPPDGTVGAVGA